MTVFPVARFLSFIANGLEARTQFFYHTFAKPISNKRFALKTIFLQSNILFLQIANERFSVN